MSNKTQLQTNNTALDGYITRINAAKNVAASLPDAGGGSGTSGVEYEIITIPAGATSATYTLPRITNAYGSLLADYDEIEGGIMMCICDVLYTYSEGTPDGCVLIDVGTMLYNQGIITWNPDQAVQYDISLLLINDPSKDVLPSCTPS